MSSSTANAEPKRSESYTSILIYPEPLGLSAEDGKLLAEILADPATYAPFLGEKLCGGFHPDYAVEWHRGADRYYSLICFGCDEIKSFGPSEEVRNDMDEGASGRLEQLLSSY